MSEIDPRECMKHGERLARIETLLLEVKDQTTKTNGRVTAAELSLVALKDVPDEIEHLKSSMGKMKDWKAEMRGARASLGSSVAAVAMVLGLAIAAWQGWSAHQALQRTLAAIEEREHATKEKAADHDGPTASREVRQRALPR